MFNVIESLKQRKNFNKLGDLLSQEYALPRADFKNLVSQAKKEGRFISEVIFDKLGHADTRLLEIFSSIFNNPSKFHGRKPVG